ncbi:MAG TPA: toxin-antitoxin system YwqK family antitoxin [Bacteroidia bacterium]|jgi:antitoxin component YwqK of YwqJK toxin-antitoxin module|nr:toxin-antitoxin system YwqK family antitoxin [Bacteroidia bacterium]
MRKLLINIIKVKCDKIYFILLPIIACSLSFCAKPSSLSFTDKAEAKNEIVKGKKTGKWLDYVDSTLRIVNESKASHYALTYYKRGRPYGVANVYNRKGVLYCQVPYVNGVERGICKYYYESGHICWEIPYTNNKQNGLAKYYYESGPLYQEIPYKDDKRNGASKMYYLDGKLKGEANFINGSLNGVQTDYYESGAIQQQTPYSNGAIYGNKKCYYESGKLQLEIPFIANKQYGVGKGYFESGKIMSEFPYVDGKIDGLAKDYYENGKLRHTSFLTDGQPDGIEIEYYESGELKVETPYKGGKVSGVGEEYYKNGKLKCEVTYRNDTEMVSKNYENRNEPAGEIKRNVTASMLNLALNEYTWESKPLIKWEDFKGPPDYSSRYKAKIFWYLTYRYKLVNDTVFIETGCVFNGSESWLKRNGKITAYLLGFFQGHFDIGEIFRRKLCKLLNDTLLDKDSLATTLDKIVNRFNLEAAKFEAQYDKETNHSNIEGKQEEWERSISQELHSLDKYSSTRLCFYLPT